MVNSGRCRSPRSRSRNTRANSNISGLTGGEQFLGGEFRRGPQIARRARAVAAGQFGAGRMQMGLVARRDLQDAGLDLGKALLVEPGPDRPGDRAPRHQKRLAIGVPRRRPPWRRLVGPGHQPQSPARRRGAAPTESINAFRESANNIDIIRLSLHRYGKPQQAADSASSPSFHVERHSACPCECRRSALNLLVFASYLKFCFSAFGIGPRESSNCRARIGHKPLRNRAVYGFSATRPERRQNAGIDGKISMLQPETASLAPGHPCPDWPRARNSGKQL